MNSTDPRPNANGGFRNGRMQSLRNQSTSQSNSNANANANSNSNSNSNSNGQTSPSNTRTGGRAANGTIDARIAGSASINNGSYAYTYALPSSGGNNEGGSNNNNNNTSNGRSNNSRSNNRAESTADSNYRYEYYRDYQSQPDSPSSNNGNNDNNNNGNNGNNNNNNNGANGNGGRQFQHNVTFSFNLGGPMAGVSTPEVNIGGSGGGGLLSGLPVNLPLFGSGFPLVGGRSEQRGFVNISPFGRF